MIVYATNELSSWTVAGPQAFCFQQRAAVLRQLAHKLRKKKKSPTPFAQGWGFPLQYNLRTTIRSGRTEMTL